MRRRALVPSIVAVAILPAAVRAQRPQNLHQIGILSFDPAAKIDPALQNFRAGLRELGYVPVAPLSLQSKRLEELDHRGIHLGRAFLLGPVPATR